MRKKIICIVFAIITAISLTAIYAHAANTPSGVLMSFTGETEHSRAVVWRDSEKQDEFLQYTAARDYVKNGFDGAAQISAQCKDISLDSTGAWHYEAKMTDLRADTEYVYRVGFEGHWCTPVSFTTAGKDDEAFSFVFMGDIQVNGNAEAEYALWGELAAKAFGRNPEIAFGLLAGDIVESGISLSQFDLFRDNASSVFGSIPLLTTNGNHESNFIGGKPNMYLDVFALPENGPEGFAEEFYSFDYMSCHVTVLNSWVFSGEQMLGDDAFDAINEWLRSDLMNSDAMWKIVLLHNPVYEVHPDGVSRVVRERWLPIFERYGVSLVLTGHQHVYSRTYPLKDAAADYDDGIIQVMGNSGQKFYDSADDRYSEKLIFGTATYTVVRIDGDEMTVQTCDAEGNEVDYCTVISRKAVLTREEYIKTLWINAGSPEAAGAPFKDTDSKAVAWAYENGLVFGYGDGIFGADDFITQRQIEIIKSRMDDAA